MAQRVRDIRETQGNSVSPTDQSRIESFHSEFHLFILNFLVVAQHSMKTLLFQLFFLVVDFSTFNAKVLGQYCRYVIYDSHGESPRGETLYIRMINMFTNSHPWSEAREGK